MTHAALKLIHPACKVQDPETTTVKRKHNGISLASSHSPKRQRLEGPGYHRTGRGKKGGEENDTAQESAENLAGQDNINSQNEGLPSSLQKDCLELAKTSLINAQECLDEGFTTAITKLQVREDDLRREKAVFCSLERSKVSIICHYL